MDKPSVFKHNSAPIYISKRLLTMNIHNYEYVFWNFKPCSLVNLSQLVGGIRCLNFLKH